MQQIQYFLALADELHFWRTAEKMFITQSALSRHIKTLEDELGIRLFERNSRNVKLTKAGEFLRDEFRHLIEDFESLTRHARQIAAGESGILRIGHPASITFSLLPDLISAFSQKHPSLNAQLIELPGTDFDSALLSYNIDIGFNREPHKTKGLTSKKILNENFALVVPAAHSLAKKEAIDLREAKDERFILPFSAGQSSHALLIRSLFEKAGFTPRVYFESDDGATILGLITRGLGISVLPFSYFHHAREEVRFIKLDATTSVYAVWRSNDQNPGLENFQNILESFIRK
ncbi:MAG TPA: LysR substrate-binding domain-containing protein [Pyrinomonadaceae bacterium]